MTLYDLLDNDEIKVLDAASEVLARMKKKALPRVLLHESVGLNNGFVLSELYDKMVLADHGDVLFFVAPATSFLETTNGCASMPKVCVCIMNRERQMIAKTKDKIEYDIVPDKRVKMKIYPTSNGFEYRYIDTTLGVVEGKLSSIDEIHEYFGNLLKWSFKRREDNDKDTAS